MTGLTVQLTAAEMEALKRAFPDLSPADAALVLLRAEMRKRYRRQLRAGRVVNMKALKGAIEQS